MTIDFLEFDIFSFNPYPFCLNWYSKPFKIYCKRLNRLLSDSKKRSFESNPVHTSPYIPYGRTVEKELWGKFKNEMNGLEMKE
jgi:hypothetical protein